jgi:hypothetical protein
MIIKNVAFSLDIEYAEYNRVARCFYIGDQAGTCAQPFYTGSFYVGIIS